jgi:3-oxoacyl-[acyl-carrier protein] reductase
MGKLTGKVAIVTGASKGIGAGIAKGLADAGAAVVVNYSSSKEGADRVVAEIEGKGGRAIAVQADVSKKADIGRLFEATKAAYGTLDILVNNAGVFRFHALADVTEEEFHREFNTNVLGLILSSQEAVKHFGAKGGSIINIGSAVTSSPAPMSVVYGSTKAAVDMVTKVLAKELGASKVRVNSINPGGTETEGTSDLGIVDSDFGRAMIAQTPLGRFGQVEDIAPVAVFLASEDSAWLTGEILLASGGFR